MGPVTNPELRLEMHRGHAALDLAGRPEFRDAWRALHRASPWATAFQDAPFADAWYRAYDRHYSPVILTGWTDATLVGLFLLAESRDGAMLCHVGAQQAEYHVWLATDARFVEAALDALAGAFPRQQLQLLFVPPGVTFP